jgi:hypothetical protein
MHVAVRQGFEFQFLAVFIQRDTAACQTAAEQRLFLGGVLGQRQRPDASKSISTPVSSKNGITLSLKSSRFFAFE